MLNVLSLFSGIGAFEKALENLGISYNLLGYSEIDKFASKAYSLLHKIPETKNYGDITKIREEDLPNDIDLITYGFPCQDISLAGKQKGLFDKEGKKTRSGLFIDALRIIERTKPKIAIAENVKNLTSKRFSKEFDIVLQSLKKAEYKNYWKILNACDYGIPQSRERVFIISVRRDIDNGNFVFPTPIPLTTCLGNFLDKTVDKKYFLSEERVQKIQYSKCVKVKYE